MDEKNNESHFNHLEPFVFPDPEQLRRRAVRKAEASPPADTASMSAEQLQRVFHDQRVRLIELELQLETLLQIKTQWDAQQASRVELLESQFQHSPDIIQIIDRAYKIEVINRIAAGDFSVENLKGVDAVSILPPEHQKMTRKVIDRCFATGQMQEFEHAIGDGKWVRSRIVPMAEAGVIPRVMIISTEITQRRRTEEALHQNHERLASVIEQTPAGYFFIDRAGCFQKVNRAWLDMHGYDSDEEVLGCHFSITQVDTDSKASQDIVDRLLSGAPIPSGELPRRRRDGSIGYHTFSSRPVIQEDEVVGSEGFLIDTTGYRQSMDALRKSESKFRETMQYLDEGYYSVTLDGIFLDHNQAFSRLLGFPADYDLKGQTAFNFWVNHDDRKKYVDLLMAQGFVNNHSMPVQTIHGDQLFVLVNAHIVNDENGNPWKIEGLANDITEHRRVEVALEKSEEKFAKAFRASPLSISIASMENGKYIDVNDMFLTQTGYRREEVVGRTATELGLWADADDFRRFMQELSRKGHLRNMESQFRMRSGEIRDCIVSGEIIELENRPCIFSFVIDITDRVKAEKEKDRLQAHLQQSQKIESVGRLAGGVAHDFNNMLGVILGYAEMAQDRVDPSDPLHDDLKEIITAAERSAKTTRQLLAFARKQTVAPAVLDLNLIVSGMHKMIGRLIGEQIAFDWHPGGHLWPVKVDPSQIDQILANLCINARDAISHNGKIVIETSNCVFDAQDCGHHTEFRPGDFVRLVVTDNGCGMDKKTLAHIFEPFYTTKGVGEGTGLGLAMVYGTVRQHDGFIDVQSAPGQGTTVSIYLPRYVGEEVPVQPGGAPEDIKGGRETILLVEDESAVLNITKKALERLGYKVLSASTVQDALRLAQTHLGPIHLLLTDVVMPEMNGPDLYQKIKALRSSIKCLFMSGYTASALGHHDQIEAEIHFLQKPFTRQDLAVKLRIALSNTSLSI